MSLIFYDDSPTFGGHEVITLLGLEALLKKQAAPVHFMASSANAKLCEKLAALSTLYPDLKVEKLDEHSSKFEAIRNQLMPWRIQRLAARFQQLNPTLVVAVQGNIEHSSLSLHAAKRAGIPSTSYIPVPHTNAEMGARLGTLRDAFTPGLFKLPDSFITITDEMSRLLRLRGTQVPIHIVYNGIDTARFRPGDAAAACQALGLPLDKTRIGMIGRIEFRQKQQHLLVEALAGNPQLLEKCHLVFAGDGPDSGALQERILRHGISATVLTWSDPALLYQAMHALVIPSRYEGLPLVMLEALASNTTVLASDRDGMKDLLPDGCRFPPNDVSGLGKILSHFIREEHPKPPSTLVKRVRDTMSLESFGEAFSTTLLALARRV